MLGRRKKRLSVRMHVLIRWYATGTLPIFIIPPNGPPVVLDG